MRWLVLSAFVAAFPAVAVAQTCQTLGSMTYCSDGQTWQNLGNMTYGNDGTVIQRFGDTVYIDPPAGSRAPSYVPMPPRQRAPYIDCDWPDARRCR